MGWGWGTKRTFGLVGVIALSGLGAGCSDDGPADPVSAEAYAEEVAALCTQHGEALADASANFIDTARSDSERIAFFRTDYIPRVRTVITGLGEHGFPEGRDAELRAVLSTVLDLAQRFDAEVPQFIDDYRAGRLDEADNFPRLIAEGLAQADIRCLG